MRKRWAAAGTLGLLLLGAGLCPAFAGDSLYGKVTEVKSADLVVFDYGAGRYNVRIIGVDVPAEGPIATEARQFVTKLVLGKSARIRFEARAKNGEMVSRLFTADPKIGIKDVGLELVRNGLARRQQGEDYQFGYKYGELSKAENEAREAKRGLWATPQPR
jgi:endonuclease YncB( thermonuclease family)